MFIAHFLCINTCVQAHFLSPTRSASAGAKQFANLLSPFSFFFPLLAFFINVLLWAACSRHMSTFDKALVCVYNIPCLGLWNEGANKLAFYVYLCVGVSEWWLRGEVGGGEGRPWGGGGIEGETGDREDAGVTTPPDCSYCLLCKNMPLPAVGPRHPAHETG